MSRPLNSAVADRISQLAHTCPVLWEVASAIDGIISIHTDNWEIEITEAEQLAVLKSVTGCVVMLDCQVNSYPLGATTTILFDIDGNPI